MHKDLLGGVFVALSAVQFGATVVVGKVATDRGVSVPALLALRFGIAAVLLAAVVLATGHRLRPAPGEGARLVALGAVGYASEAALFFLAIERGTASAVTLLFFVYPVIVALLSVALGRGRPGRLIAASLTAAVSGAALVVASSGRLDVRPAGIALALGSGGAFAVYLLVAESAVRDTSSLVAAAWVGGSASVSLGAFAALSGARLPDAGVEWLAVGGMGAFTAGAFFCLFAGLRLVGAVRTAIIAALEPASTAVLATVFLDETIRAGTAVGGVLILGGAVAASLSRAGPEAEVAVP